MQLAKWAALALTLAPAAVGAEQPDVEAIIDRCWAASKRDLSSDSTLRIGRGVSAVTDCLERDFPHGRSQPGMRAGVRHGLQQLPTPLAWPSGSMMSSGL